MATTFRQDMPPAGGYPKFQYNRTYARAWATAPRLFAIAGGVWLYAIADWIKSRRTIK